MKKIINLIFNRLYKYYGEYNGLLYSTTLLGGMVFLIGGGIYVVIYKAINRVGEPLAFLDNSDTSNLFRLVWGPLSVIVLQQIFYQSYRYRNYYKEVNIFFEENKPDGFLSKNAHYISFILSIVFFLLSLFTGDFVNSIIYK